MIWLLDFFPTGRKKHQGKSWEENTQEGTIILNTSYCYCLIKILKCSCVGATEAGSLQLAFPFCLCACWQKTCPLVGRGSGPQTTALPLAGLGIMQEKQLS